MRETFCGLTHAVSHEGSCAELPRLISPSVCLPECPRTQDTFLVLCVTSAPHGRKSETLARSPDKQSLCRLRFGWNRAAQLPPAKAAPGAGRLTR